MRSRVTAGNRSSTDGVPSTAKQRIIEIAMTLLIFPAFSSPIAPILGVIRKQRSVKRHDKARAANRNGLCSGGRGNG